MILTVADHPPGLDDGEFGKGRDRDRRIDAVQAIDRAAVDDENAGRLGIEVGAAGERRLDAHALAGDGTAPGARPPRPRARRRRRAARRPPRATPAAASVDDDRRDRASCPCWIDAAGVADRMGEDRAFGLRRPEPARTSRRRLVPRQRRGCAAPRSPAPGSRRRSRPATAHRWRGRSAPGSTGKRRLADAELREAARARLAWVFRLPSAPT